MEDENLEEDIYGDFGMALGGETSAQDPTLWGQGSSEAAQPEATLSEKHVPPLVKVDEAFMADTAGDLYDDLYSGRGPGETLLKTQLAELQERVVEQEGLIGRLQKQVEELEQQNGELARHKAALATNISSLYKTAKLEIQRKDDEIKELRERLSRHAPRPSSAAAAAAIPPQQHSAAASGGPGLQQQQSREGQAAGGRCDLHGRSAPSCSTQRLPPGQAEAGEQRGRAQREDGGQQLHRGGGSPSADDADRRQDRQRDARHRAHSSGGGGGRGSEEGRDRERDGRGREPERQRSGGLRAADRDWRELERQGSGGRRVGNMDRRELERQGSGGDRWQRECSAGEGRQEGAGQDGRQAVDSALREGRHRLSRSVGGGVDEGRGR